MRVLVSLVLCMLACGAAQAATPDGCTEYYSTAETAMTARQANAPMPKLMHAMDDLCANHKNDGLAAYCRLKIDVWKVLVKGAYDTPLFSTQKYKDKAVRSYANEMYQSCLEHGWGKST